MNKPFFSIVIPTYNRCHSLKGTITVTLGQTFKNFEIIISDNASTDETMKVVKSFKDKRIRYFRNSKNIGAEPNYKKAFSHAKGDYIFSMGDDDFIIFNDTLEKVKIILEKEKVGFLRLNLIERKFVGSGLRKSIVFQEEDLKVSKNTSAEEIIGFFNRVAVGHLAGLVIKNSKDISNKLFNCTVTPWVKAVYEEIKKNGAYFLAKYYMIITWSQGEILNHYNVPSNNRLMFETYTDYIFKVISPKKLNTFKLNFYNNFVLLQPAIKLYSNNGNLIKFDRRLLQLEPRLKKNPLFWLMAAMAYLMPKFIWKMVRVIQHRQKNILHKLKNISSIEKRFAFLEKSYF